MIVEAILIGIFIGIIRKGSVSRLKHLEINLAPMLILSMLSILTIVIMNLGKLEMSSSIYTACLIAAYAMIIIVLFFNLDTKYMFLPLTGTVMNFICLCFNSFKIPVRSDIVMNMYGNDFYQMFTSGNIKFLTPAEDAAMNFLGKLITPDKYYFYNVVLSIGDILILLGIVLIIQSVMTDRHLKASKKITISRKLYKK